MELGHYLEMLRVAEQELADSLRTVGEAHAAEPEIRFTAALLASWAERHVEVLKPFCARYAADAGEPPEALHDQLFHGPREGGLGTLRDLHDLFLQASSVDLLWTLVSQAAKANRDEELGATVASCDAETARTLQWLRSTLKTQAPQALVVS